MLVLTGAAGKITAVTVWEENIVTKQKNALVYGRRGRGINCAGVEERELQQTWRTAVQEPEQQSES